MSSACFSADVYSCCLPRPSVSTAEWCCRHLALPSDANTKGMFRLDLYPHAREWLTCCDDPEVEKITIQAASRIGKTFTSIAFLIKTAATNPHPMALADADEKSTRRVIRRIWRTLERCEPIAHQVPPRRRQASDRIECTTFTIEGAWSGSPATAADYPAFIAILNETDKMRVRSIDRAKDANEQSSSAAEADFRKLMAERTKGFGAGAKLIQISTPTLKGGSWIEAERLAGDNRARFVPCPFCNHFQTLRCGNGKDPGGIRFEKLSGKLHVQTARDSAWYECEKCRKKIFEEHRVEMLQAGRWVPEGCHIDKRGRVAGTPARPGPHASFGPLSTLHSLLPGITIGRIAQEYVEALTAPQNRKQAMRNFVNSWMAETWDPTPPTVKPSDLVLRMAMPEPRGTVPRWAVFLTEGVDVGQVGGQFVFYWWVSAWGPHARGHCVDLGITFGWDEFLRRLTQCKYRDSTGRWFAPVLRLIDSSSFTQSIYELCAKVPGCMPIKGGSKGEDIDIALQATSFLDMYQVGFQTAGVDPKLLRARKEMGLGDLIIPNTDRSQDWIERRLDGTVKRTAPDWYSIPEELLLLDAVAEFDLAEQLLGEFRDGRGRWLKRIERQDLRDAFRYSMVAAWFKTKNGRLWSRITRPVHKGDKPATFDEAASAVAVRAVGGDRPRLKPGG